MMAFLRTTLSVLTIYWVLTGSLKGQSFEAGVGVADLTPQEFPLGLMGSFNPRLSETVHDPLSARALALRSGKGRAVIVMIDNVGIKREAIEEFKEAAAEASGWHTNEMMIAATHSHSAPSLSGGEGPRGAYRKLVKQRVVSAITKSIDSLQKARVGFGADQVPEEVFNRRWYLEAGKMPPNPFGGIDQVKMNPPRKLITKPAGPTDPTVAVIDIRDSRGKPLSILANYPLHYVGAAPRNQISADYFGEFARLMPFRMRGAKPEFMAMLSNGASGDINNIDFTGKRAPRAPFEQIQQVATKVADAAWKATSSIEHTTTAAVSILQREVTLKYRKPSVEAVNRAQRILEMNDEEKKALPRLADHYAVRTLRDADRPDTTNVVIQALRIGEQAIVSLPFEVLVEIGLDIKKRSPFKHTMLIELANGWYGYLPDPKQHKLGGYETWPGTCHVQEDASVILSNHLIEMLEELKP